jgi:hypothetical protein
MKTLLMVLVSQPRRKERSKVDFASGVLLQVTSPNAARFARQLLMRLRSTVLDMMALPLAVLLSESMIAPLMKPWETILSYHRQRSM